MLVEPEPYKLLERFLGEGHPAQAVGTTRHPKAPPFKPRRLGLSWEANDIDVLRAAPAKHQLKLFVDWRRPSQETRRNGWGA